MERASLTLDRTPEHSRAPEHRTPEPRSDACPPGARVSRTRRWVTSLILLGGLSAAAAGLAAWKTAAEQDAAQAAAHQPEHAESVMIATAVRREHQHVTTSIGTVLALRSTTLRNELPGIVRQVFLTPGRTVEEGELLVALDVSVEEAELRALKAQAALAETAARRIERAAQSRATSQMELDRARAELDVALAQIARVEAIIARKTIRAPFKARIGLSDIHPGQYLQEGTLLTTLQGIDESAHVDFTVPQHIALRLEPGDTVEIVTSPDSPRVPASIVALDARVDPATRNTTVRALVADARFVPPPGASVRVRVPAGPSQEAVSVPISALRRGPAGDHVFVIAQDEDGNSRAQMRRVRTGPVSEDEVLILEGLKAGDQVATFGSFKLREGALVAVASSKHAGAEIN
jgi:membrane fusion protein (multidrug efflux system)